MRVLLPVARGLARLAPGVGEPLLGALLLRCLTPGWVLLRPSPPARLLAWAEEAVAVLHRAHPSRPVRLARALALHAHALDAMERHEEACAVVAVADAVPGARPSPAETAYLLHVRTQALLGSGRAEEALEAARRCVETYRHGARLRPAGTAPWAPCRAPCAAMRWCSVCSGTRNSPCSCTRSAPGCCGPCRCGSPAGFCSSCRACSWSSSEG
ncbi:hypothetical protein ACWD3I_20510 [Streptomyces sp. NPDC002817]|uniref:hypothetical protein n=1 Tax=Streptomyces sp. NPDC088357 TaxID=3154655 RepID=UPI00341C2804